MVVVAGNGDMYEIFFGSSYCGDEQEAQNQEIYDWEVSHIIIERYIPIYQLMLVKAASRMFRLSKAFSTGRPDS